MATYEGPGSPDEAGKPEDVTWDDDPELTPENLAIMDSILRARGYSEGRRINSDPRTEPSSREIAKTDREETAKLITNRLEQLQVRDLKGPSGLDRFTARDVDRNPDLSEDAFLIDDVHYAVYQRHRSNSPSPYLTVSLNEILSELTVMRETHVLAINFQRKQLKEAEEYFQGLSISDDSFHEVMSAREGRQMVRSFHRLMLERPMARYVQNYKKMQSPSKWGSGAGPIGLPDFANRALKWFDIVYSENRALGENTIDDARHLWSEFPLEKDTVPSRQAVRTKPKQLDETDPDAMAWHDLRMRELDRARAFTFPVAEYLEWLASSRQS